MRTDVTFLLPLKLASPFIANIGVRKNWCAERGRRIRFNFMKSLQKRARRSTEDGFTLVMVIFLLALFTIAMAVAAPEMAKQIQLDREHETMEVGKQYVRAIQLYYRKFHAYPPNIKALLNTDDIRFLRKQYKDPLTGKKDWRLIHFGQQKTQPMGFFGQPLAGAEGGQMMAGVGPAGGGTGVNGLGGMAASPDNGAGSSPGGGSPFGGGSSLGGSSLGGSSIGGSSLGGSSLGGSSGSGSSGGTQSGSNGSSSDTSDNGSDSGSGLGLGGGQMVGGLGIVGVAPALKKQSIMIYKKKDHYNEWEFVYNPLTDIQRLGGNTGMVGQSAGGMSDQNGGFGTTGSNNGGFGGNGGTSGTGGVGESGISGSGGIGGSGLGGSGLGGAGIGGSGLGGSDSGGSSPTPQPQ